MKKLVSLILISLISLMISCNDSMSIPTEQQKQDRVLWLEKNLKCHWIVIYSICICTFNYWDLQSKWGGAVHVPDRICKDNETGAYPR